MPKPVEMIATLLSISIVVLLTYLFITGAFSLSAYLTFWISLGVNLLISRFIF